MNPVFDQQSREIEEEDICREILKNSRNELYLHMRFLDNALAALGFGTEYGIHPCGVDGERFFCQPQEFMELYCKGAELVNRAYLHGLLHCIFLHPFEENLTRLDPEIWNLACDMAVEQIIDGLYVKCVHVPPSAYKRYALEKLREPGKIMTAQRLYHKIKSLALPNGEIRRMRREFYVDDHGKWYERAPSKNRNEIQKKNWEDIRNKMQTEMETFSKEAAKDSRSLMEQLQIANRHRYDYREFLRKFSVLKEEMKVDMDTFDYIFYNYGMNLYGNMPLIEPLETKEERKVEDFVIVIDTSMSCKGELVQKFLEETYGVLSETESFFRRIHIHLIQCDDRVQSDVVIENAKQLQEYMEHFTVKGQGGTDFRPPFAYVEELMRRRQFTRLRGLIYFTDGYGIFPAKKPPYETAFVFMKEDYRDLDVPPWAIKLILGEEDLGGTDV